MRLDHRPFLALALGLSALAASACETTDIGGAPRVSGKAGAEETNTPAESASTGTTARPLTAEEVRGYLRELAPYLISRELEAAELDAIETQKAEAIVPVLTAWTQDAAFAGAMRRMISQKLYVSGQIDGIDFDLPGNLTEHLVRENLPISHLLTADYCVDAKGAKGECDTGAPYKAGVLTTRAYLVSRASRFNLRRAGMLLRAFACQEYPMSKDLQPRIEVEKLIPMFASDTERDENGQPKATFGNGTACYTCHGQFSVHSQLFVRFDGTGKYRAEATGLQDPEGEVGRAKDGLFASHLKDPAAAKEESTQLFGQPVKNLQDAARVMTASPEFIPCQARNLMEYALRLGPTIAVAEDVLAEIATSAGTDATFATLVIRTFGHPRVVEPVATAVSGTP